MNRINLLIILLTISISIADRTQAARQTANSTRQSPVTPDPSNPALRVNLSYHANVTHTTVLELPIQKLRRPLRPVALSSSDMSGEGLDAGDDDDHSSLWWMWRFVPFIFAGIGAMLLIAMFLSGECSGWCCSSHPLGQADDVRVSNLSPTQPLRASLLHQQSLGSMTQSTRKLDPVLVQGLVHPLSTNSSPIAPYESPESPYSPMHSHPYATVSYQNPTLTGTGLVMHPPDDLNTPRGQNYRTITSNIQANRNSNS